MTYLTSPAALNSMLPRAPAKGAGSACPASWSRARAAPYKRWPL